MSPLSPSILLSLFVLTFGNATNKTLIENVTKQSENCSGKSPLEAQARRSSTAGGKVIPVVFGPLPKGSEYATGAPDSAKLNPYHHIKEILNFIHPSPFPADLYKDILQENIPYPAIVVKILEMELGFLAVLFLSLFLALVVPAMVIGLCSTDPTPPPTCAPKCKRRTLVFCLQILLCFLLMGGAGMIWTNEECSKGVAKSPEFLNDFFKDSKQFFEDGTDKLKHLLTDSYDQAISPATHDLNDAENLIGRPIQVGLILETGLDTALDSLVEIAAGGKEVCSQVSGILMETAETEQLMLTMEGKLEDLRDQIRLIKKHCLAVDKPLCDLVTDQLIDIRFTTKMITNSSRLTFLKQGGIDTLSASVLEANAVFTGLPIKIDKETKGARIATLNEISKKKTELAKHARSLDVIKTRTGMALYDLKSTVTPQFEHVLAIEHWRWLVGLVAGLVVVYIWALMTGATCCGCCGADKSSSPTLTITLILTAIVSVLLWILSFMVMYIGGHGETCICRTMDEDNYNTLSQFIDTIMNIDNVEEESYISDVIHRNGSIGLSLGTILSGCKRNESIYKTFNLNLILDIEKETNVKKWNSINSELENLETDLLYTQFFNPKLLNKLSDLQNGLQVNVTSFRTQLMSPISTDLESVIKQLLSISKQINDLSTSSHLESLAIKSRNLLFPLIQELESKKENLVYHLTALELKISPLLKQVNQSLSHMKAVQYYISNHGSNLAQQNLKSYTKRIQNYFDQYRNFVNQAIDSNETSCRDFWNMFESLRLQVCRKTIDPLNGFWFATVWCLFLFMLITPICIKLIHYYNLKAGTSPEMTTTRPYVSRQGSTSSPDRGSPDTENSPTDNW